MKSVRHVADDIIKLYEQFGYEEFLRAQVDETQMYYSLKKLTNDAMILKIGRNSDNALRYKLSKYVVDKCLRYVDKR